VFERCHSDDLILRSAARPVAQEQFRRTRRRKLRFQHLRAHRRVRRHLDERPEHHRHREGWPARCVLIVNSAHDFRRPSDIDRLLSSKKINEAISVAHHGAETHWCSRRWDSSMQNRDSGRRRRTRRPILRDRQCHGTGGQPCRIRPYRAGCMDLPAPCTNRQVKGRTNCSVAVARRLRNCRRGSSRSSGKRSPDAPS
jgi:hypothetical protein